MSELTGSNHRCRAQFKCAQTVIGQCSAENGPRIVVVVVVIVVVVVGQTVGPFQAKRWHDTDDCYQFTRTFGGFSAQCLSKLFLKEFTVLLLTTSLGREFQVEVILIG